MNINSNWLKLYKQSNISINWTSNKRVEACNPNYWNCTTKMRNMGWCWIRSRGNIVSCCIDTKNMSLISNRTKGWKGTMRSWKTNTKKWKINRKWWKNRKTILNLEWQKVKGSSNKFKTNWKSSKTNAACTWNNPPNSKDKIVNFRLSMILSPISSTPSKKPNHKILSSSQTNFRNSVPKYWPQNSKIKG